MAKIDAAGPNAQQIEYWNEVSGARWVEMNEVIDAQLVPLGKVAIERAAVSAGERILDVGCGCGQSSLQLAAATGSTGEVVGVDISGVMLARARERAADEGLTNLRFLDADAQTASLEGFDLVFSRFGVMFFSDPEAAFRNLLGALKPGGRLVCVTWQPLPRNDWMFVPIQATAPLLPSGGPPPDPTAPGPFALADSKRFEGILSAAGFESSAHESLERELLVGGGRSLDETAAFVSQLGPSGAAMRDASPELRSQILEAVRGSLEAYAGEDGIRMAAAAWIVTANRPS